MLKYLKIRKKHIKLKNKTRFFKKKKKEKQLNGRCKKEVMGVHK